MIVVKELLQAGFSTREIATKLSINKSSIAELAKWVPETGLKFRAKRRKPLLTDKHRKARRVFAKEYRHWTVEQWKNVIWSDECKGGGHSIMIWGCMTWAGLGLMVYIDDKLNSEHYIELLEEAVPGSILKWKNIQRIPPRDKLIFQQDNACPHTAKVTKEYLEEVKLNVLPWPAMSPDLNPIEHVWQQLKKQLYQQRYTINNKAQLIAAINRFWATFPKESVQALIKLMPRRLQAVRVAKGGHTKY
ncbi:hypothetical protein NDA11_007807 [Ustilago hordei]|nr:hypothetical protein NDA10_006442 [Ustilago hordei]KAJ1571096.1 hypothetical protein NDA11_007807 [Ustilago hordei]KAJ1587612.1 hypothetical protein NDA15_007037 [Ustilago hordei]